MTCKSIMLCRHSLLITYVRIFAILMMWCIIASHQETYNYKEMEIIDDLPVKNDIEKYLLALEKIVYFVDGHRFYVDVDLCFGIYLINVNLRKIVQLRGHYLTFQKQVRMMHIVKTNDDLLDHFIKVRHQNARNATPNVMVKILNLYVNRTVIWPKGIEKFHTDLLKKTKFYSRKNLELLYFKWPKYLKNVYDYKGGYPTPEESDHCLNLLAQNPISNKNEYFHCQVPYNCLKMLVKGYDYGYGIAHRLLFLLSARYWRNCVITSVLDDKQIIDGLCSKMYNELEYMAYHEFALPDLFMEHVTLCSIEGHAQFLRRSWIDELLDYQTAHGCFNLTKPSDEPITITTTEVLYDVGHDRRNKADWNKVCNSHVTGVASAMLASAIRLIMENYF